MFETLAEWSYLLKEAIEPHLQSKSPFALLIAFAAGVLASLSPCVFPMIPVTVTFMGNAAGGSRRQAVLLSSIYVGGLALVYAGLGVIAAAVGARFGSFTRTPWVYGGVALVIVLLGAAMMGWITVPVPGLANTVQSKGVTRGGVLGALLIGMSSGFIAAPCTAPVLGFVLFYIAGSKDYVWGGAVMIAFALGLGLLLLILGIFSGMLSRLPPPGPWMNRVKWVFGIGMFATAAYLGWQAVTMAMKSGA